MPTEIEVFVRSASGMQDVAREAASRLGINLVRSPQGTDRYTFADDSLFVLYVDTDHLFENDRDMEFERYDSYFQITTLGFASEEEKDNNRLQFARWLFDALSAAGRFGLMMVLNMQEKLDEYDPS